MKEHNESAPTTPHLQGINQPCSIGHPDPTLRRHIQQQEQQQQQQLLAQEYQ